MTYPLTGSLAEVTSLIYDLMIDETNAEAIGVDPEKGVFYGDQDLLNTTPMLCVEPDTKEQDYKGSGGVGPMMSQNFIVYILCYHSAVKSPQGNRKDADAFAERVETVIHSNRTLGGKIIEMHVATITSGYATKSNTLVRASRVTITGKSQTILSQSS